MFKGSRVLSPELVNEFFQFRNQISYKLRQRPHFRIPWAHLVFSGTEILKFPGPKVWPLVPDEMKQLESPEKFSNGNNKVTETYILSL